ncbi:hypothetical protein B0T18DRAFT_22929 [Schizothecium vesticola]|uniref:Uncharacterized protein n=1 Tax=Schizothecium vesticola TaxID=314040 RepID=A0AA40KCK2_9PEZI|nr:hypothetical protein B0T18DRAFT_22929 [Schizothecium vesticola]
MLPNPSVPLVNLTTMADTADAEEQGWASDSDLDDKDGELWNRTDHFTRRYQCCICGCLFVEGDRLVGLVEGRTSIHLGHITNPFLWEQSEPRSTWDTGVIELAKYRRSRYVNGRYLCGQRDDECWRCWRSRGTASAHIDCLLGFKSGKTYHNKLHRLWRFAQARRPHPNMPELLLPELTYVPTTHLAALPPSNFFSILTRLPQEVLQSVREHPISSPLWQILAGLDLSDLLSALPRHTPAYGSLPLNAIASWERGTGIGSIVPRRDEAHGSGHARLVMDSYGIRRVESVPYQQGHKPRERHDNIVFITMLGSDFG